MRAQPVTQEEVDAATSGPLPFFRDVYMKVAATAALGQAGLRLPRLRCPAVQSAARQPAAGHQERQGRGRRLLVARRVHPARDAETSNKRAGGESVLAKLTELMFIEVVRRYLESLPPGQSGWLAGLRDPFVGKALSLMHGAPAHAWTIEALAHDVGRLPLGAGRTLRRAGRPAADALSRQLAHADRRGPAERRHDNIATIAAETGYGSEAAFSRAFKKMVGLPPAAWRRRKAA